MTARATETVDICVLCFSSDHSEDNDHCDLVRRCLNSVLRHTPSDAYRLFIGCNNIAPRVERLVGDVAGRTGATVLVGEPQRDADGHTVFPKYPLMRTMLGAGESPWVVWLDDDSFVTECDWLERLWAAVRANPGVAQFGKTADAPMADPRPGWIENATWYRPDVQVETIRLADGSTRLRFDYIVGGFYAIRREAIRRCDIPDPRLFHNGGDWATGLALAHQGYAVAHHTYGVEINAAPRRGMHADRWQPPGRAERLQRQEIDRDQALYDRSSSEGG